LGFSVLMSIYKGEDQNYFNSALQSIWDFQSLRPNEIILVQDGVLTKSLHRVIESWKKKIGNSLIVVCLPKNVGLAKALNKGIEHCKYELIARMDTDDISLPNRFEVQYNYMNNNENISVCGSYIEEFHNEEDKGCVIRYPIKNRNIYKFSKLRSPICHPACMFRKVDILKVGGYPNLRLGQDYGLWILLLSRGFLLSNIPKVLLKLRVAGNFMSRRGYESLKYEVKIIRLQYDENMINFYEFGLLLVVRSVVRLSPVFLKKIMYRFLRK